MGGAGGAMMHLGCYNAKKNARIKLEKDFIALNREAVRAGLVTEREQMKFRNTHDIRVTNKQQKENQECNIPDIMFGVPTRPSTPFLTCSNINTKKSGSRNKRINKIRLKTLPKSDI